MAEKSDEDSDHGDDLSSPSLMQQIKRLEKEKADLEKRNKEKQERQLLQDKLKELQGSITSLKSPPNNNLTAGKSPSKSPGSGRGKGKGRKNSPASNYTVQFDPEALLENHRTRSKSKNRPAETETVEELDSDDASEDDDSDEDSGRKQERVMSHCHKQKLQEHRDTLVENMISEDIFNDLIANRILTTPDVSRIKEKNTREAINEELLNNLVRRSDRAFFVFVHSLQKTLQGYLADLLDEQPAKQKKRKRKRAAGEMNISVDVEDVSPSRRRRKPDPCTCQQVEEQMLQMAKNAYRNIRRRDDTPASFEQFKKELSQTNTIVKDSMEIMHTLKILCRHGDIEDVSQGSVKFTLRFRSARKLCNLWHMYKCGKLLDLFQAGLVTKCLLRRCAARQIRLGVRISEEEYQQCLGELEEAKCPALTSPKSCRKYARVALSQENLIPQENLSPLVFLMNPVGKALSDTPHGRPELSNSDPGPRCVFREIHRNVTSRFSDISTITHKPSSLTPKLRHSESHHALLPAAKAVLKKSRLRSQMAQDSLQRSKVFRH